MLSTRVMKYLTTYNPNMSWQPDLSRVHSTCDLDCSLIRINYMRFRSKNSAEPTVKTHVMELSYKLHAIYHV